MSESTPEQRREAGRAEMRTAVAILTAHHQALTGQMTGPQCLGTTAALVDEQWPTEPLQAIPAVTYVALRLASLLAEESGQSIAAVLQSLGTEAAVPPTRP